MKKFSVIFLLSFIAKILTHFIYALCICALCLLADITLANGSAI